MTHFCLVPLWEKSHYKDFGCLSQAYFVVIYLVEVFILIQLIRSSNEILHFLSLTQLIPVHLYYISVRRELDSSVYCKFHTFGPNVHKHTNARKRVALSGFHCHCDRKCRMQSKQCQKFASRRHCFFLLRIVCILRIVCMRRALHTHVLLFWDATCDDH